MMSYEKQIYYALDKVTYLAGNGITVHLSVKKDGSFDMTVNPYLLRMIDEDECDDEGGDEENDDVQDKERNKRCLYIEVDKYLRAMKDINLAGPCIGDENISELCAICPYKSKV